MYISYFNNKYIEHKMTNTKIKSKEKNTNRKKNSFCYLKKI